MKRILLFLLIAAPACPTNYTCGYIFSWATCTNATTCPTPGNPGPGPYTALQTAALAILALGFAAGCHAQAKVSGRGR